MLEAGATYTVPSGATSMKAWAIGSGCGARPNATGGGGNTVFKTWSVTGGSVVNYSVGQAGNIVINAFGQPFIEIGTDTTITYSGATILAFTGSYSSFVGPLPGPGNGPIDGGVFGNVGNGTTQGGAVGGGSTPVTPCNRRKMNDVSGLISALTLAGARTTEICDAVAAFGSGAADTTVAPFNYAPPGQGGGGISYASTPSSRNRGANGAVVLYFT